MIKQCWSQKCLNPTKKRILVDYGTFILPVMWFSYSKLSSEIKIDLLIFRGSPKQYWSQNFVYLTQKKKDLLYNDTFILPDLVNMASLCSGVGSDLTAPFKLPGWKKLWKFEKIAWKTKKWYPKTVILSGMQCHLMSFYEIS